jgi:hypothetical protein
MVTVVGGNRMRKRLFENLSLQNMNVEIDHGGTVGGSRNLLLDRG